ncbi:OB-fold domain-containing protein [Micromonospora sp. NPDC007271]|uniref:Zn-ribbon domain-containing OB-fold protein n=1 Tax=Micromonospora sp. NPDC007271 TaxID=3154587 RepID=UPI0033C7E8FB
MTSHRAPAAAGTRRSAGPPALPGPTVTPATEPFWSGLRAERLLLQQCERCGAPQHYPRAVCRCCWSEDLRWIPSTGRGTVWTFTVVHRPGNPAWAPRVPYAVLIVELDEGPRLVAGYTGLLEDLSVGLRVAAGFEHHATHSLLVFHPEPTVAVQA